MIRSKLLISVALVAVLATAGCQEDPEAAANNLFVEASTALTQADAITGVSLEDLTKRRDLLSTASTNLEKIVSDYPSASLAVDLAASGSAKGIVIADVEQKLDETQHSLECAEKPEDGECAVDALLNRELARELDSKRRAFFSLLLSANGRWDQAIEIANSVKDNQQSLNVALFSTVLFSILLNEPSVQQRVIEIVPERDKDDVQRFVAEFGGGVQKSGWKVTEGLATNFTIRPAKDLSGLASEELSSLVSDSMGAFGTSLKAGDMEGVRTNIVNAYLIWDAAINGSNEDQANLVSREIENGLDAALKLAFPRF